MRRNSKWEETGGGGEPEKAEQRWGDRRETKQRHTEWENERTGGWETERERRVGNRERPGENWRWRGAGGNNTGIQ